ncbi:hypothetical protein HK103_006032 [Boothiomyces macroporosus]|uniref:Alkaline phosphatase family protein n=1 Tax=Boothiomyces macroporosus TaxID=261099 RepID=A0AAD5UHF3_9FUNG|nr:hypothetical protein HK103_006032 [Boothiomyces macroporosus]
MHLGQVEAELIYESHQLTKQRRSIRKYIYGLMAFILGGSLIAYRCQKVDRPLVILVSLDGTRPEYLQRGLTPNLNKIGSGGYMSDMIPVFPSITFPNHYSLATGLIVGNVFYDPVLNDTFVYTDPVKNSESKWWNGEPIWITAVKNGLKSAVCFWPGSEAPVKGLYATYWKKFNQSTTIDEKLGIIFNWIDLPPSQRPSIISVYFPDIDHSGHVAGPNSEMVNNTLMEIDNGFGKLMQGLVDRDIQSSTEIVVVSDHGMGSTDPTKVIYMDDLVPEGDYDVIYNGVLVYLYPKDKTKTVEIAEKFKQEAKASGNFRIWLKEEIPYDVHYNSTRVGPILLIPEREWNFVFRSSYNPENPPFPKGS